MTFLRISRLPRGNPWIVLVVVSVGYFMPLLDLTIVNIAVPNLVSDLHTSFDQVLWVINGYTLALAALLVSAGRLGDLFGPRAVFAAGIALFTAASVACAAAQDPAQLIAFRVVQGAGAAVLVPQTLTIVTHSFPAERRGTAFGVWGAVAGLAAIAGPTLGGTLVTTLGWRWIFLINLPIGIVVLVGAFTLIPETPATRRRRLDLPGVLLATLALSALCFGLVEGQRYDWGTVTSFVSIPLVLGVGVALLALFLLVEARSQRRDPLVPFALFADRDYALMNVIGGAVNVGMLGFLLLFNLYLQAAVGMSAMRAGLTLAPAAVVSTLLAPLSGKLSDRFGGRRLLVGGLLLFSIGMGWMAAVATPDSQWYTFLPPLVVTGVGMGGTFAPMPAIAMRGVPPHLHGSASAVFNADRQLGAVLGTAAVGALLQNRLSSDVAHRAADAAAGLPAPYRAPFVAVLRHAAGSGLAVGAGGDTSTTPAPGVPQAVVEQMRALGRSAVAHALVDAVQGAVVLPVAAVAAAALCCLALRARREPRTEPSDLRVEVTSS